MIADELVEEVDEHGTVLRVVTRAQMRAEQLCHRATYIGVVGSDGRLLIHQRSADKEVYPSYWDVCAGGVCTAGESWDESARRELREELGIEAELLDLGGGHWVDVDTGASLVGRVFLARHDGPFAFDDGEVVRARFVTFAELDALLARRDASFCPDSVELALPRLQTAVKDQDT